MTSHRPELILGTAQLTTAYGVAASRTAPRDISAAVEFLDAAALCGVTTLDTAPVYGDAEMAIGWSSSTFRVHTKIDPSRNPDESYRESLERLGKQALDVVYIHDAQSLQRLDRAAAVRLEELSIDQGFKLGVSIYDATDLDIAQEFIRIDAVQVPMNVLDRRFDRIFVADQHREGRQVFARSVFLQGTLLQTPERADSHVAGLGPYVRRLRDECDVNGISPLVCCLDSIRQVDDLDGVIIGVDTIEELKQICEAWADTNRRSAVVLDDLSLPPPPLVDPRNWR